MTAKKILATTKNPTSPETRGGETSPLTEVSKRDGELKDLDRAKATTSGDKEVSTGGQRLWETKGSPVAIRRQTQSPTWGKNTPVDKLVTTDV